MTTILAALSTASSGSTPNVVYLSSYPGIDRTGVSDSGPAVKAAFAAVAGSGATLIIDCQVKISLLTGSIPNVAAPIFVPNFLNINFSAGGMFVVDNILIPAFCFLHTTDNTWNNPHIRYVATSPLGLATSTIDASTTGSGYQYFSAWNDGPVKTRMALPVSSGGFGNTFVNGASAMSSTGINGMAVFSFRGDCRRIVFNNLVMDVPALESSGAAYTATKFIPVAISLNPEWKQGSTIGTSVTIPSGTYTGSSIPQTAANTVIPSKIIFNQPIFDGFLMGIVGAGGFEMNQPVFKRYSDLQDASYVTNGVGGSQGGTSSWFPVPHCFSLASVVIDPTLPTAASDVTSLTQTKIIHDGFDFGLYVGGSTRRSSTAGSMCALRISPDGSTHVDGFKTLRPDGLIDIVSYNALPTGGGELLNLEAAAYNSALVHSDGGSLPAVRFPTTTTPYLNIKVHGLSITDTAPAPVCWAINGTNLGANSNLEITNLQYRLNDYPSNGSYGISVLGANVTLTGDIYLANCTTTQTYKALVTNASSVLLTNVYTNLRVWGWRVINSLTFTAPPSGSSGTLSANWLLPTDAYVVKFPSGQQRLVTLTLNATTATWSQALPAAETGASFIVNCINSLNINAYRNRLFYSGSTGVYAKITDVSNGLTQECDNGVITETWSQHQTISPLGATQATTISFPSTFGIDRASTTVSTTLGTVTSFGVGWTGSPTALLATQGSTASSNAQIPIDNTWPKSLSGSSRNIILTPTSGSFDGTGSLRINVRGVRMYGA